MEDLRIENYLIDLNQICLKCRRSNKCSDHNKICVLKKLLWNLSLPVYKKRVKEGKL